MQFKTKLTVIFASPLQMDLRKLAAVRRREKSAEDADKRAREADAKSISDSASVGASSSSSLVEAVDVDVDSDEEMENDRNKMTENTPEARIEVGSLLGWLFEIALATFNSLPIHYFRIKMTNCQN